jgi:hypothetical protein
MNNLNQNIPQIHHQNDAEIIEMNDTKNSSNKLAPVMRSISIGSSAALFDTNSSLHRKSFDGGKNETYRAKETRKSSIVFDKCVTKRRVSQVKCDLSGQPTQESFENECETHLRSCKNP